METIEELAANHRDSCKENIVIESWYSLNKLMKACEESTSNDYDIAEFIYAFLKNPKRTNADWAGFQMELGTRLLDKINQIFEDMADEEVDY